jgi:hypothetical protein
VYGPVRTVVWEGRSREAPPYPDRSDFVLWPKATEIDLAWNVGYQGDSGLVVLNVSFVARDPQLTFDETAAQTVL